MAIGIIKRIYSHVFGINQTVNAAIKYPKIIPVHLAHTGSWYPLKKKLLSGI